MASQSIKLNPGDAVLVSSATPVDPGYGIPDTPKPPVTQPPPVDPGYGIDLGLGYLRPTHPIVLPPPVEPPTEVPPPVDPGYGIDEDIGYVRPSHPIVLPPPDPAKPLPGSGWELTTAWTPVTGWVVVAVPTGPTPTPAKRK